MTFVGGCFNESHKLTIYCSASAAIGSINKEKLGAQLL
jgi:hypothetical protein